MPSECDDGPFGKGTGGELRYDVSVPGPAPARPFGSRSPAPTRAAEAPAASWRHAATTRPASSRRRSLRARAWLGRSQPLPCRTTPARGTLDRVGQAESRRPHADRRGPRRSAGPTRASSSRHRSAASAAIRWVGAGYPGLPMAVRAPTASTRTSPPSRSGSSTSSRITCARCATSPTSSTPAPGVVVHEVGRGRVGLVRQGLADDRGGRHEDLRLQHRRDGQVPERRRSRSGAGRATTASATRCTTSPSATCRYVDRRLDVDQRRLAGGLGQRRAHRDGPGEARQRRLLHPRRSTTSPTWRAPSTTGDAAWASNVAPTSCATQFEDTWWNDAAQQYADSLVDPGNVQVLPEALDRPDPMEAELYRRRYGEPGMRLRPHGTAALAGRENRLLQR